MWNSWDFYLFYILFFIFAEFTASPKQKKTSEETSLYDGGEGGEDGKVMPPSRPVTALVVRISTMHSYIFLGGLVQATVKDRHKHINCPVVLTCCMLASILAIRLPNTAAHQRVPQKASTDSQRCLKEFLCLCVNLAGGSLMRSPHSEIWSLRSGGKHERIPVQALVLPNVNISGKKCRSCHSHRRYQSNQPTTKPATKTINFSQSQRS